jgi:hypothetical protein
VGYHRGRGRPRGQRGQRAHPRTGFGLDSPGEDRSVGRRNRPRHSRPGRNRSRRATAEQRARAELDRDDPPALPPRGRRREPPPPGGPVVRCPSGKSGFAEAEARRRLEQYAAEHGNRRARPVRVYPCPKCGAWHLTSRE